MNTNSTGGVVWTGADVSKKSFDVALHMPVEPGTPPRDPKELPCKKFTRDLQGVKKFKRWADKVIQRQSKKQGEEVVYSMRCVMEATGKYSRELAAWLIEIDQTIKPVIEDPKTIKDFKSSLKLKDKTDSLDAAAIARFGAERMPEPAEELPEHYLELRELSRERDHIRDALTASRLRLEEIPANSVARGIQDKVVKALQQSLKAIEDGIKEHVRANSDIAHSVSRMQSIPGVGFISAVVVLAEVGPLTRFKRSKQLSVFAGLAPVVIQSGTSVQGRTRISKKGPGRLRQALYMASISACEKQPKLGDFLFRLRQNGKSKLSARCAVMRKLLVIMRAVVVNDTNFSHDYATN